MCFILVLKYFTESLYMAVHHGRYVHKITHMLGELENMHIHNTFILGRSICEAAAFSILSKQAHWRTKVASVYLHCLYLDLLLIYLLILTLFSAILIHLVLNN
jgi:hypothetical protein